MLRKGTICGQLYKMLKKGKSFDFNYNKVDIPEKGIYIFYEKSEKGHGGDRIVRVGITKEKPLYKRLTWHYQGTKRRSIFRKNIGRAILCDDEKMLNEWNKKETKNSEIEECVTKYFKENFCFKLIEINNRERRIELESKLIGTISNCNECRPSQNWFGNKSPVYKVKKSGLWQEQHLYGTELTEKDLVEIENGLVREDS